MNTDQLHCLLNSEVDAFAKGIARVAQWRTVLTTLPEPVLEQIDYIYVGFDTITLSIKKDVSPEDARNVAFALTRITGVQGEKKPTWDKTAIVIEFSSDTLPTIKLTGYTPPTCHRVKKTRIVPARPEETIEYEELVCTNGDDLNEPVGVL